MKRNFFVFFLLSAFLLFIAGCLTCEKKEYSFELTGPNSGKLTIKYINIMSMEDDEEDISADDYDELINDYISGNTLEEDYPYAKILSKRLYAEGGVLNGEVVIEFSDLSQIKLFKYDKKSPYMYTVGSLSSEEYSSSNGSYGGEDMPVVFWPKKTRNLTLVTKVTSPSEETHSLLSYYKK